MAQPLSTEEDRPNIDEITITAVGDDELAGIIADEISNALGHDDDEIEGNREDALDYYLGRLPGNPGEGNSKVLSMDVADMVEATLSQVLPAFSHDDLARFLPESEQDEDGAQLESDAVNYVFMQKCQGQHVTYTTIKDGLLQRNGIIKTTWRQTEVVRTESYEGLTQFELPQVLNVEGEQAEVVEQREREAIMQDQMGNSFPAPVYDIKVRYTSVDEGVDCFPIPPEEFLINTDHHSIFMDDARFVAHRKTQETESALISQGYDPVQIRGLATYHGDADESSLARNRSDEEDWAYNQIQATRNIEVYECYMLVDRDGDGIAERRRIMYSNNQVLKYRDGQLADEEYPTVPFATGTPFLMPHRWLGISMFDKIRQVQDTKTALLRQAIDNGYANNNQRVEVVEGKVNMEDVSVSRAWGPIRVKEPGMVRPLPVQNIGQSSLMLLEYMDQVRRERGGAQLDMGSQNLPVGMDTAHGAERVMSSLEMLSSMISKSFAETMIKVVYLQIHELLRLHSKEPITMKRGGNWVQSDPSQWPKRDRIIINVGLSAGERNRRYTALTNTLSRQIQAIDTGNDGILTNIDKVHNTLLDIDRSAGIEHPGQYWIDPTSKEAQEAMQNKQEQQSEDQAKMEGLQQQLASAQQQLAEAEQIKATSKAQNDYLKLQLDQAKAVMDAGEKDNNLEFDYAKLAADVAVKLTELQVSSGVPVSDLVEMNHEVAEEITDDLKDELKDEETDD